MSKEDHLEYLKLLKEMLPNKGTGIAVPKREGAFYFGHYISYSEYVDKYEKQCIKEGWL